MDAPTRLTDDATFRQTIITAGDRLEQLRRNVERHAAAERPALERVLDTLRGRRNRAMARVEAARQASEEGWDFARASAAQAIDDLLQGLEEVEAELSRAAA